MGLFSKIASSFVKKRVSNTKTALEIIVKDFKRYITILKYIFVLFSVLTLIYNIYTQTGVLLINCILLGVIVGYTLVDALLQRTDFVRLTKKIKRIYKWTTIILNLAALSISIYAIYSATSNEIKPVSIILATLSIIFFILKVVVEIVLEVLESKWDLLKTALIMDAKDYPGTTGKILTPFFGDVEDVEVKESYVKRIKEYQNKE